MECDEEEDANSLLSLSQTFLQPDSSSSSIGLSANQLHNWSALTSTATDVTAQFSPVSPADGYNTNTGHTLTDNETNFRFYGARSTTSQSAARSSVSSLFSRSGSSGLPPVSISNSFLPVSRVGNNEFNQSSEHIGIDTITTICYEQTSDSRTTSSLYGDKDAGYSSRSGLIGSTNLHHADASNSIAASFAHNGYSDDHNMLSLTSTSDVDGKLGIRSVQLDQKMFDSRSKQQAFSKDLSNLYDPSTEKPLQSTEITMSFDRRDNSNFDSNFEFSSDPRDFAAPSRLDALSATRGDQEYHQTQKYLSPPLGDSDVLNSSVALDSKRLSSSYMNFGLGGSVEDAYGRLNNSQKKSSFNHLNDLPSDLEPVFQGYHTDFGGHQKFLLDNHRNFGTNEFQDSIDTSRFNLKDQMDSRDCINKWSGRPRAHRKMARLLGSEEHRDYSQVADVNNSHKPSFSKVVSSIDSDNQDKSSYQQNIQRDLTTNSRTFLTMEEELDLRTNHHQQRSFVIRRDESLGNQTDQRELGLLQTAPSFSFDSNALASSMHKDTASTILAPQHFLPSAQLDLDFHSSLSMSQSQKELDLNQHFSLQVSKDFGLETSHSASNQDDLSFDHSGNQHVNQNELSLADNLGMVPHVQELSLEAYFSSASEREFTSASDRDFNSTSERDLTFCRKFSAAASRDLNYAPSATVNDFNIEDYMNPQMQRDLSQSYFSRPDLPQDMTVYQKPPIDKTPLPETFTFKDREKSSSAAEKEKQGEISELQKELTKTSTKESMKGIKTPRDINRAMEILQGLQEDEREEEKRKKQHQRHQHLQGLLSNPKKTFQSKHNIENLSISDQQFLGSSGNFTEGQSVGSFLDHPHLTMPEQDSQQMVQAYQTYSQIHQPIEVDMASTLPGKRDLQQNLAHSMTSEMDIHFLKRLTCSASVKDTAGSQGSSFSNNTANLASLLAENSALDSGMQFPVTGIHFQTQQSDLEDVVSNSILNSGSQTMVELNRPKNEMAFMDFESHQSQHNNNEKPQTSFVAGDTDSHTSMEISQIICSKQEVEILNSSRKNLYDMMKLEQFCDAVLSTPTQTVKVHQVVLCSMSQYLTTLLHKMKPTQPSYTTKNNSSPSLGFTSQTTRNSGVLLVVNCDGIKSSSMMTFLLYIYLGKAELNESNVLDIYVLACSLRVQSLKDLCKEFMWQAHIPNEQIKVPQLLVSSQRLETLDQSTMTEISTDDKSTNTSRCMKGMEVATQTDRSTSEAGGGGQEEWVMLKKTKQKTVSPSKSRLIGKSLAGTDSPIGGKSVKKGGWLSPKRRYKTENQIEEKNTEKEVAATVKESVNILPVISFVPNSDNKDIAHNSSYNRISETEPKSSSHESHTKHVVSGDIKSFNEKQISVNKQTLTPKKSARTTVEIAAAAAAAKLASHSYGTRTARGMVKIPVSYASLASGLERKKSHVSPKEKTFLTMSKKKDFIKSNSQTDFSMQAEANTETKADSFALMLRENVSITCSNSSSLLESDSVKPGSLTAESTSNSSEQLKADTELFKSLAQQPFKKSIVHRSRSEEVINKNDVHLVSTLPKVDISASSESDFMDTYLIDSLVNTMECDNAEVDFQKVISDLDTFSKSPLLTTASSSVSSTSLTSPLKSPTTLLSTPDSSSPLKARSTPQGFRKRLIHQINAEKNGPHSPHKFPSHDNLPTIISKSSDKITLIPSCNTSDAPTSVLLSVCLNSLSTATPVTPLVTTSSEETFQNISPKVDKLSDSYKNVTHSISIPNCDPDRDHIPTHFSDSVDELALSLYSLGEETDMVLDGKTRSFSSMTDIDLGLKDDTGSQFFHKIFKRKKRCKPRKSTVAESEASLVKTKLKKLLISDTDGGVTKPRQRKAAGSDTEGGARASKQKKNVFSENEGVLAKVRPPPKKRAKMELQLLKAGDSEKLRDSGGSSLKSETEQLIDESKRDSSGERNEISDCTSKANSSTSNGIKEEPLNSDSEVKVKKTGEFMKTKSQRSSKTQEHTTQLTDVKITMETKLTLMLEELVKSMDLKTRQFSCKLCQTKTKSARRTIKHMRSHGLTQEDALQNIAIGEKSEQEACDICGYLTKDQSYHYMHLHKYFKHGVPLPLGWSTDKCEVCGKECFNKFQLKEHMMSHDDSHCFICWHCGQSFKMRNSLNNHVFHKHSDIRKHQCKACEKSFKTWTHLKVHVRSHTGERPFACIDCGHRSTTQGNLKFHLMTHGYSKEKSQELMEKICKNVPEIDPESLEKVMLSIADKVKAEQISRKEKKSKKKPSKDKAVPGDQIKSDFMSPAVGTSAEDNSKKRKTKSKVKEEKTASVSKSSGSQIKRLLTQPLSKLKPPKFMQPQLSQPSVVQAGNNSSVNEESGNSQMFCDSADSSLSTFSMLLQQQNLKQETGGLPGAVFFIPLPQTDQQQQQQQRQQQQHYAVGSLSSMMGYTVIPTHILPVQAGTDASIDSSTGLALPVFSTSDVLSSGLNMIQSGIQTVQLVQTDGVYPSSTSSGSVLCTQDSESINFLNTSQGHDILQDSSVVSLQYPNSKIFVTDSTRQELNTDAFQAIISTNGATTGSTTMVVLSSINSTAPHDQSMHQQVQTIFSYPSLISSSQPVLLPVTPGVQIIPSNMETSNFVNFSVTVSAPEEVTLNMSHQNFEDATADADKLLANTQENVASSDMTAAIVDSEISSGPNSYSVVKCVDDICTKEESQVEHTKASVCMKSVIPFS